MAEDDIFNEDPNSNTNTTETGANTEGGSPSGTEALAGTGDQAGEILNKWVGDGKKFASVEELVKSYDNSQQFIEQLKQENADMRRELTNAEKLDQILNRIEASGSSSGTAGEGPSGETPPDGTGQGEASSTNSENIEDQISKAVQQEVTRREKERTAQQNQDQASEKLVSELAGGDRNEAKRLLKKTADDLGVSVGYLQQQAQVSPSAFYRMVSASKSSESGEAASISVGNTGSHNAEAFETNTFRSGDSEVQPWSYWQKKKREMSRSEFYSPTVQNRIFKSRQQLGEDKFFDT